MTWAIFDDDDHYSAIFEVVTSQSHRTVAIVGGSLLDHALQRTLSVRLRNDNDIARKLLKVNGPLGNAEPKVDVLYMLGAFEKLTRNTLYGIIKARNYFAHNLRTGFNSNAREMTEAMGLLTLHRGRRVYPHRIYDEDTDVLIEPINNNLGKFIINLKLCLIALMRDRLGHEPHSNKPLTKAALREQKRDWKKREREAKLKRKPSPGKPSRPKVSRSKSKSQNRKELKPPPRSSRG